MAKKKVEAVKEPKIFCAHTKVVDAKKLKPNPRNPNKHPENQIKMLAYIIERQGWRNSVVVSKRSGLITKGHGRLEAALLKGWKVPVDEQNYKSATEEYADMVADNKIAELSASDNKMILEDARKLPDLDLNLLGIPDFELPEPGSGTSKEDDVPTKAPARTKLGDIWELGKHRLLCGDSTKLDFVLALLDGEKPEMVFTDPPYNYQALHKPGGALGKQATKVAKKVEFMSEFKPEEFLKVLLALSNEPFAAYIFCNTALVLDYLKWADENKFKYNILTWHKPNHIPSNSNHHYPDTEYCIYVSNKAVWHQGLSPEHYRKYWIQSKDGNDLHPTMKPVSIIEKCIELNSKKMVLDLFGGSGSGSTLIACEKTGRKCFMMELDQHYCDIIIERWQLFTGQKAKLLNSKQR